MILGQGDMVQVENSTIGPEVMASGVELLVAGISESHAKEKMVINPSKKYVTFM